MARKKEDKLKELEEIHWVHNWNPTKKPKVEGHFFPDSEIWDENENSILHRSHQFPNEDFQLYKPWNKNRKWFKIFVSILYNYKFSPFPQKKMVYKSVFTIITYLEY